jgi:hypothetical protein
MKRHRDRHEFNVTAVKTANSLDLKTTAIALYARFGPEVSRLFAKTPPGLPTSP